MKIKNKHKRNISISSNLTTYFTTRSQTQNSPNIFSPKIYKTKSNEFPDLILNEYNKKNENYLNHKNIFKSNSNHKNKYKILMKKLENWDTENINMKKKKPSVLFSTLNNFYKNNNLNSERNSLKFMNNLLQSKNNFNKIMEKGKASNKILDDFYNKKNKEEGSILKNNLIKTTNKFSYTLKQESTTKNLQNDFNFDIKTINYIKSDDINNDYYQKVIKEKIKNEIQLREELFEINKKIFDKKNEEANLINELSNIYQKQQELKNEYNKIISEKHSELLKFQERFEKKTRKNQTNDNFYIEINKNASKNILLQHNLKETHNLYQKKFDDLKFEKQKILKLIEIKNLELEYLKQVNYEITKENKIYFLDILKNGYDSRNEGLIWVVKNLMELDTNLEYHNFPKFLTHEEIDFILKISDISLEENQLNIILKTIKDKQSEIKFAENIKNMERLNAFFEKYSKKSKAKEEENDFNYYANTDYSANELKVKKNIDKKFLKIYMKNDEIFKMFTEKNLEETKIERVIKHLRKNLKNKFFEPEEKKKENLLEIFMANQNNKMIINIVIYIRKRLENLKNLKKDLYNKQINDFKLKEEFKDVDKNIKNSIQQELVKKCLFGTNINI